MNEVHSLLKRILKKSNLSIENSPNEISWTDFVEKINTAFFNFDEDRKLLENSLLISSKEMSERYTKIEKLMSYYKENEFLLKSEITVFEKIIKEASFFEVCKDVLDLAEKQLPGMFAAILLIDDKTQTLNLFYAPQLPIEFANLLQNIPLDERISPCGKAIALKEPIILPQIDPINYYGEEFYFTVKKFDFSSIWSFPILINNNSQTIGTLAFYFKDEKNLSAQYSDLIHLCKNILVISYEKMQQKDELERERISVESSNKMATLGEMASSMAHEINNPLSIIHGNCQMIKKHLDKHIHDLDSLDVHKLIEYCSSNINVVSRINKIIKGLKSFSRDAQKDPFEKTNFKSILEDTLIFCESKFKYQNIHFSVEPKDESLQNFYFECRGVEISQVILNLLNNAADAILQDHKENKWIKLTFAQDQNYLYISIIDSGLGIPPHIQEKMFHPFFTTKAVGKGTGLGLSICVGIIKNHNGSLKVDNNSTNSKFDIVLPLKH